jgi:hypothetical protein
MAFFVGRNESGKDGKISETQKLSDFLCEKLEESQKLESARTSNC